MAKAPALSKQLKNAQARIVDLEKQLDKAVKDKDMWFGYYNQDSRVIEELHTLLDTLPNPVPRRNEGSYTDYSPIIRLASYFANKENK